MPNDYPFSLKYQPYAVSIGLGWEYVEPPILSFQKFVDQIRLGDHFQRKGLDANEYNVSSANDC